MSEKQFSLLTAVFLWIYGLFSPLAGFLADRFGRSRIIFISLLIWSIVTWLTAHATNFNELLATRALMGLSEACYIPAALALICDYHKGSTQSTATGIHMAGVFTGASLGFIGGWIAEEHSWHLAFELMGITGTIYAFVVGLLLRDPEKEQTAIESRSKNNPVYLGATLKHLFSNSAFILLLIFWGLLSVVSWLITAWLPTYYIQQFSLSQKMAGIYATAYLYPASVAGLILGGIISDKASKRWKYAKIGVPAFGLLIAAPAIYFGGFSALLPISIALFMLYAITKAFSDTNMMPMLSLLASSRQRATGYGMLNLFSCLVGGLGIYAGGYLRDSKISFGQIFGAASLLIPLCIIILWITARIISKKQS